MAKQSRTSSTTSAPTPQEPELSQMEKETFEKVSSTLGAIDRAITAWDSSKSKPAALGERIAKLKRFQVSLNSWVKEFASKRGMSQENRLGSLVKFIDICYSYEN
jgi:hypothetical protein